MPSSFDLLAVDLDREHAPVRHWDPLGRVLVVEGPGRHDDEECEGGAGEADVDAVVDVLGVVAGGEGDDLRRAMLGTHHMAVLWSGYVRRQW
jgi:hypothetical protein